MNFHPLEPITFKILFLFYFLAAILYLIYAFSKNNFLARLANLSLCLAFSSLTLNLIFRTIQAHRAPFSNLYESLLIFIWGITLCYLILMLFHKIYYLGVFISPLILGGVFFASALPKEIEPLMPALQSNWMVYHVLTAIIAYGAFAISFGLAILYLIREKLERKNKKSDLLIKLPSLEILDNLIYKVIAFAFPFLVLLIITGAIWAEVAWGSYWSWDPKETWSLIVMLIYAGFLHARLFLKWRGKICAIFALCGFISVILCYLGVNLFLSGLHSYGGK